jgi:hypothetical protein
MKTPLTFLLSLTFLFLYPSISFSQTFKCEFVSEKFKGGKTNEGRCSGDPELSFDSTDRSSHCESDPLVLDDYVDYLSYIVDLDNKVISYVEKGKGRVFKSVIIKSFKHNRSSEILSVHPHEQKALVADEDTDREFKVVITKSYLVVYKTGNTLSTLYIPENEKSIISWFKPFGVNGGGRELSIIDNKFGKCVNTSK